MTVGGDPTGEDLRLSFLVYDGDVPAAYATGTSVAVGAVAAGLFGLLAANGIGLLYWSTTFDAA